ncbi:hypothetical protein ACX1DX_03230 [Tessaracoccus sp. Y36]|tara:strand:- start:1225 stop:1368 length:144 start_codon:yes stop_codon:yes gene_type:complete
MFVGPHSWDKKGSGLYENLFDADGSLKGSARFVRAVDVIGSIPGIAH